MRIATAISARQTKHPAAVSDARVAQDSQNRACRHGTSAKPARGATTHTWQQSSDVDAAAAVADSCLLYTSPSPRD